MNGRRFFKLIAVTLLIAGVVWLTRAAFSRHALASTPEVAASEVTYARVSAAAIPDEASVLELANTDPAAAAKMFAAFPRGDFHEITGGKIATAFARIDPVGAFWWAQTLDDEKTRLRAVREVAAVWAESHPMAAAKAVALLSSDRERQLGALAVATGWTRRDPAAAIAWAETLVPREARALVLGSAVQTWAERDAAGAMDWLAHQSIEFHAAIDLHTTLAILAKWAEQAPVDVREFVHQMPTDAGQVRAAQAVALQLAKSDPLATLLWALELPQPASRNAAFSTAYRQWREDSPGQAQAWLNAADLIPEEKLRLVGYP